MTRYLLALLTISSFAFTLCLAEEAGRDARNLPEIPPTPQTPPVCTNACECACSNGSDQDPQLNSVNAWLPLGQTSPQYKGFSVNLLAYAEEPSPALYTPRALYVETPIFFRHLSNGRQDDGTTPTGYTFGRQGNEKLVFEFAKGSSSAKARPGENSDISATLRLVGSDGSSSVSEDPYFADLETGNGEVWRFAVKTTEANVLGEFIFWRTSRGITLNKSDLGIDIKYDKLGRVSQILTPSRLAVVESQEDGFSVTAYPVEDVPEFDDSTGLYVIPAGVEPTRTMTISHDEDIRNHRKARVTIQRGTGTPLAYIYDRTDRDWEMTKPDGTRTRRETSFAANGSSRVMVAEYAADGKTRLKRTIWNYDKNPWGYSLRKKEEGWGDCSRTDEYMYLTTPGITRGKKLSHTTQSGLRETYAYDAEGRLSSVTAQKIDGTGDVKITAYSYASNVAQDVVVSGDTRPRMETVSWNGVETERTFYVYSSSMEITERAFAGSPFGAPGNRRTTRYFDSRGRVTRLIAPEGVETVYSYDTDSTTGILTTIATTVDRRTVTITASNGYLLESRTEALSEDGQEWLEIARTRYTRNAEGKAIRTEDLAGRVTTAVWDCCNKVSETSPDGTTTLYTYDINRREIARSVLTAMSLTNETYVTRCTEYDAMGRVAATWTTNLTEHVGLPKRTYGYDYLGRRIRTTDERGNETITAYSPDGLAVTTTSPTGLTSVRTTDVFGRTLSTTGTASVDEYHRYAANQGGTTTSETRYGTLDGARFVRSVRNSLGDVIAEERPAFGGGVVATTNEYDIAGRIIRTTATESPSIDYFYDVHGVVTNTVQSADGISRSSGSKTSYARLAEAVGGISQNATVRIDERTASCSDDSIAPLRTRTLTQLDGFVQGVMSRSVAFDVRGNATESAMSLDGETGIVTTETIRPEVTNPALNLSRFGATLMTVSYSSVTNSVVNDALGRTLATTDGRGNTTTVAYNALGERETVTDAAGNTTRYAYDVFGRNVAVTNALGLATVYAYDARGNKTYEGGATYPVSYTYDDHNVMASMTTYRNEASTEGDTTSWNYDEATGLLLSKTYADGKGPTYTYTPNGKLASRTWARGVVTTYSYDGWGNLTNTTYSDGTPSIALAYDAMGRQISATDVAGTTTMSYDDFGSEIQSEISGLYGKTLIRHRDAFGRDLGHTMDGSRKNIIEYEEETGRIKRIMLGGAWYTWEYLAGSDLKSSLSVGTAGRATWVYEPNRNLLTQVKNEAFGSIISQYDYTNDAIGRRTAIARSGTMMSESRSDAYGYNTRSELISAAKNGIDEYAYQYDDIGNRESSVEPESSFSYTANELNQYTEISAVNLDLEPQSFVPQYDDDGNQTLVKTKTGIWSVTYNGENRPISWTCGATNIVMKFDRMGRRVEYVEMVVDPIGSTVVTNKHQKFVYDGYLCIQRLNGANNAVVDLFEWDPTERVATRPLYWQHRTSSDNYSLFYTHDGNKNVSEAVFYQRARGVAAHYEYAPFGEVTVQIRGNAWGSIDLSALNPWRFSSECADDLLGLVYYNYRHYEPMMGRWLSRDSDERNALNLAAFVENDSVGCYDALGRRSAGRRELMPPPKNAPDPMTFSCVKEILLSRRSIPKDTCCNPSVSDGGTSRAGVLFPSGGRTWFSGALCKFQDVVECQAGFIITSRRLIEERRLIAPEDML